MYNFVKLCKAQELNSFCGILPPKLPQEIVLTSKFLGARDYFSSPI